MSIPLHIRVASHPRFRELVGRRTRFAALLSIAVLLAYYGFMMVVAFKPGLLRTSLGTDHVTTIGWPVGAAVIVVSWLLTGWYVFRANREFDPLNAQVLDEVSP